ncbi:MAG: hypothetical protein JRF56_03505 [Deltaproteobacteria bacterium]|nr:hypothetical protein [Deltaproteobacteria bacterium]
MKKPKISQSDYQYNASIYFVGIFYLALLIWTVICVWLIGSKTIRVGWPLGQLLMIGFVLAYTWYFSLGISYKIRMETGGNIELTSFRRVVCVNTNDISMVEGPRFAVTPYGFIRFRLKREKAYLFCCISDVELQRILKLMRKSNQDMKFKGI